jgi:hypothetical protein
MAATDPTVQTQGRLMVGLKADMNVTRYNSDGSGLIGLPITFAGLVYGPQNAPPPAWSNGPPKPNQYRAGNGAVCGAMGMVLSPGPAFISQTGACWVLSVWDMSAQTVLPNKTYAFAISVGSENWIQLYVRITGGPNGSTVLPGFGLWNLGTNRNAWTYVTPQEPFTGEWMIGLHSPASFAVVWLSVEYAPPKDYRVGIESRLLFTIAGLTLTRYIVPPGESQTEDLAEQLKGGIQHLHARSRPHILHSGPGVPMG